MKTFFIIILFLSVNSVFAQKNINFGVNEVYMASNSASVPDNNNTMFSFFKSQCVPAEGNYVLNKVVVEKNSTYIALVLGSRPKEIVSYLDKDENLKVLDKKIVSDGDNKCYSIMAVGKNEVYLNIAVYRVEQHQVNYYIVETCNDPKTIKNSFNNSILLKKIKRFENIEKD